MSKQVKHKLVRIAVIAYKSSILEKKEGTHSWLKPITSILLSVWKTH